MAADSDAARMEREHEALERLRSGAFTMFQAVVHAGGTLTLDAAPNPDYFFTDFDGLRHKSHLVVLAHPRAVDVDPQLSDDGRSVVTRFEMLVDEIGLTRDPNVTLDTLKQAIVEVPGGRLPIPGAGVADMINGPTFEAGRSYLLFLQPKRRLTVDDTTVYEVMGAHYEGILPIANVAPAPGEQMASLNPHTPPLPYDREYVASLFTQLRSIPSR